MSEPGRPSFVSLAFVDIPRPDFADVVVVAVPPSSRALAVDPRWWAEEIFSVRSAPWWIKGLLALRQAVVGLVGIRRASSDVFDVATVQGEEALIVVDDTHLDFRAAVAIDLDRRLLRVTTTVRLHGWRGRLYFTPVSILHGPVTRSMARAAVARWAAGATG